MSESEECVHMTVQRQGGAGCCGQERQPGTSDGEPSLPGQGHYTFSCRQWSHIKIFNPKNKMIGFASWKECAK